MIAILYKNQEGSQGYKLVEGNYDPAAVAGELSGIPGAILEHVFDAGNDLISSYHDARNYFAAASYMYGLRPSDFGRRISASGGKTLEISGLQPKNRKYQVLLRDVETGERHKASPAYVKRALEAAATP